MTTHNAGEPIQATRVLDVRLVQCPGPILKARQALDAMAPGEVLRVEATDPGSVPDFQALAKMSRSVSLLRQETLAEPGGRKLFVHYLEKRG